MRPTAALVGIVIAGVAGYFLEPSIRPSLIKVQAPQVDDEDGKSEGGGSEPEVPTPTPAPQPAPAPAPDAPAWVASLTPEQLPEKVTLKRKVEFTAPGASMQMDPGASVIPVRVEGTSLVVSPFGGPLEAKVAVMETDLVERLGNKPPEPEPTPVADNESDDDGGEEMVADNEPDPQPEPEPEPEPEPAPAGKLDEAAIVSLMQDSIRSGGIKEFSFDQVLGWKAGEEEERDGETYQTGLAAYKAETIFGVKTIQAQALIKDGKIVRWIWPKSGMEIR